ncbi:MAG TPA: cobalamin-dependent protein, partial [Bacteroidales bacterium]
MQAPIIYKPKYHVRIVTAASLFDGHDAAINVMRRIIQASGAEVIHLGHNRSVHEIVNAAIQEDAQAIALTSYQGGHMEFLKYMFDMLKEKGAGHIKIFAGGGGVILPDEAEELHRYGIDRIYSPDDGMRLGLQGMINDLMEKSDFPSGKKVDLKLDDINTDNIVAIAKLISAAENNRAEVAALLDKLAEKAKKSKTPVLGITGTGGAGKSSLIDELVRRFLNDFKDKTIAIISVDPTKRKSGGALLGDRIRMNAIDNPRVYMRSLATRQANLSISNYVKDAETIAHAAGFDFIILETSGIGQSDTAIVDHSDVSMYVMTPEYGAATQLEKIDMLDFADIIAMNKSDKRGAQDALHYVKKQYQRNNLLFDEDVETMPVFGTVASQFNDPGVNELYINLFKKIKDKTGVDFHSHLEHKDEMREKINIIPPQRVRYLSEIAETVRTYNQWAEEQGNIAQKLFSLNQAMDEMKAAKQEDVLKKLKETYDLLVKKLTPENLEQLQGWEEKKANYTNDFFVFKVRDK